jgi:hypothetical protein
MTLSFVSCATHVAVTAPSSCVDHSQLVMAAVAAVAMDLVPAAAVAKGGTSMTVMTTSRVSDVITVGAVAEAADEVVGWCSTLLE